MKKETDTNLEANHGPIFLDDMKGVDQGEKVEKKNGRKCNRKDCDGFRHHLLRS